MWQRTLTDLIVLLMAGATARLAVTATSHLDQVICACVSLHACNSLVKFGYGRLLHTSLSIMALLTYSLADFPAASLRARHALSCFSCCLAG